MNVFDKPNSAYRHLNSVGELLTEFTNLQTQISPVNEKEHLWFRGQKNAGWHLIPSIQRCNIDNVRERELTNDFRIRASRVMEKAPNKNDFPSWMAHMQHHGLPTRMLDWSESPLIAAFFALDTKYEKEEVEDAAIWVLRPGKLNKSEINDEHIYPLDSGTAARMLQTAFKEKADRDKTDKDKEVEDKILACYSVQNDLRMYSQQSCFTIHNTQRELTEIIDAENILYKYVIPAGARQHIRDELKILGITTKFIYPDLDHIVHDIL